MATGHGPAVPGAVQGSGLRDPAYLVRQDRRPGGPALRAPPPGRRPRRATAVVRRGRRRGERGVRPDADRRGRRAPHRHPARAARAGRRRRGRGAAAPGEGAAAAVPDPQGDAPAGTAYARAGRTARATLLAAGRAGLARRTRRRGRAAGDRRRLLACGLGGVRHPDDSAADLRPAHRLGPRARVRSRRRLPLRRRRARRDRRGRLHRLPGVLHRRHRLLPARSRRPRAHRPRRPLLQRADRAGAGRRATSRRAAACCC